MPMTCLELPQSESSESCSLVERPVHRSICPRTETVEGLSQLLDEYKVIHVREPPASGKTALAKLLERYLRGRRIVYIPSWKTDNLSATRFLEQEYRKSGYTHDRNLLLSGGTDDIVFIIDDAQKAYSGSGLWYSVIKSRIGLHHGPRFYIFSSYRHPLFSSPSYPEYIAPAILRLESGAKG